MNSRAAMNGAAKSRARSCGQILAEFALVIPMFLALSFGVFDVGRVVWASNSLQHAAAEAARFAIVHGGTASDPCPVGPLSPQAQTVSASPSCPHPGPSKQAVVDAAKAAAIAAGSPVTVSVCYGAGCSGDTDAVNATNARGTPVTVTVTSQIPLTVPGMLGMSGFTLTGRATMLVNH